jgi:F-type H+-transporting ATPase subunit b
MDYVVLGLPRVVAQEEHTETQEPGAAEEHNPLIPELEELIPGVLAFLIVFVVLWRFAFPRLNEAMRARTEKIRGDLEKAEQAKGSAESALERYEEQLREARAEAGKIIDEARKTAEQVRKDAAARAEDEARQTVAKAQEEIRAERDRALQELRSEVGALSVTLAERVVGQSLDKDRQLKLVDDYIDELTESGNGKEKGGGGS